MDAQELVDILRKIAWRHYENREDEGACEENGGDKFLSDTSLYAEIVEDFLLADSPIEYAEAIRKAKRDGWIDNE